MLWTSTFVNKNAPIFLMEMPNYQSHFITHNLAVINKLNTLPMKIVPEESIKEQPWLKLCSLCRKKTNSTCARCGAYYCSKTCQINDYKNFHKDECVCVSFFFFLLLMFCKVKNDKRTQGLLDSIQR